MPRQRWKLIRTANGTPELDYYGDIPAPAGPVSLLASLAADPASGLEEIAPGRYWARKIPRDR